MRHLLAALAVASSAIAAVSGAAPALKSTGKSPFPMLIVYSSGDGHGQGLFEFIFSPLAVKCPPGKVGQGHLLAWAGGQREGYHRASSVNTIDRFSCLLSLTRIQVAGTLEDFNSDANDGYLYLDSPFSFVRMYPVYPSSAYKVKNQDEADALISKVSEGLPVPTPLERLPEVAATEKLYGFVPPGYVNKHGNDASKPSFSWSALFALLVASGLSGGRSSDNSGIYDTPAQIERNRKFQECQQKLLQVASPVGCSY